MKLEIMTDSGPVDEAFGDCYGFGDRILEGVLYRVRVSEDGTRFVVDIPKENRYDDKIDWAVCERRAQEYFDEGSFNTPQPYGKQAINIWIQRGWCSGTEGGEITGEVPGSLTDEEWVRIIL
jgi:hypothetical protein